MTNSEFFDHMRAVHQAADSSKFIILSASDWTRLLGVAYDEQVLSTRRNEYLCHHLTLGYMIEAAEQHAVDLVTKELLK